MVKNDNNSSPLEELFTLASTTNSMVQGVFTSYTIEGGMREKEKGTFKVCKCVQKCKLILKGTAFC